MDYRRVFCISSKIVIFIAVLFNIGDWDNYKKIIANEEYCGHWEQLSKREQNIRTYEFEERLDKRFREVRKIVDEGGVYSPYDYFDDYLWIKVGLKRIKINRVIYLSQIQTYLHQMCSQSLKHGYTDEDIEKARTKYEQKYEEALGEPSPLSVSSRKPIDYKALWRWLCKAYWSNMLIAVFLYLIWIFENSHSALFIPKPFKAVILVVFYPIYITRIIITNTASVFSEAEIRRRKDNLFAPLSQEEIAKLKDRAKRGLSYFEWRSELNGSGLGPKHGMALALAATVILLIIPRDSIAQVCSKAVFFDDLSVIERIGSCNNLARMSIDQEKITKLPQEFHFQGDNNCPIAVKDVFPGILRFIRARVFEKKIARWKTNFFKEIFHIPLKAVRYEAKSALLALI